MNAETPRCIQLEVLIAEEDLYRHSGNFSDALASRERRREVTESDRDLLSYDEAIMADTRLASALYDAHDFGTLCNMLREWHEKIQADPQICTAETRSFFLNTLARGSVILSSNDWCDLFRESIKIQTKVDISHVPRTTNYLIHGLLRHDRLTEAKDAVDSLSGSTIDETSKRHLDYLKADLDRRSGETYSDDKLESVRRGLDETCHATGFLLQSVARQRGRSSSSRSELLKEAEQVFMQNVVPTDSKNVKRVLAIVCRVGAAISNGAPSQIDDACSELEKYIVQPDLVLMKNRYQQAIMRCRNQASVDTVDELIGLVPYF